MKKIVLTTLLLFAALAVWAQAGSITATVVDADTGEGVVGAVVELTSLKNPEKKHYTTSAYKGAVSLSGLPYGEYKAVVSFLGYNNVEQPFTLNSAKLPLGKITLKAGVMLDAVVKEAKALRTSQKGDTVSYNAGSFKVTADANVEGLLKKMPGITISNGAVEAQGESVKKVFVDGKEFFGEDVTTAIKSLPAEAVDRIEVYDKLSDASEFSGMDDGEGYKAINIVTHANMRQGQFGKFYAGYGYDPSESASPHSKYIVGGNANVFSGDSRVSVIGLFNNINQQNFSFEDILGVSGSTQGGGRGGGRRGGVGNYMVRPQDGVASVNAVGINYSDTWGKRKQLTFQGSYFFNNTETRNTTTVQKWYETPYIDTLSTSGDSKTLAYNHRFNARLEWKISDKQNLLIRPSFSYQSNDPLSSTFGTQFGQSGYSIINNYNDAIRQGYNFRTTAVYRAKLGKDGRTITLEGTVRYADNTNNANAWSNQKAASDIRPVIDPASGEIMNLADYLDLRYVRNLAPSMSYKLQANATYTEPIAKYAQLSFQYRFAYDYQERNKKSYITGSDFEIGGRTPDPSLSNSYSSGYMTQSFGPGFRYAKERNNFVANVYYQRSSLDGQVIQTSSKGDPIRRGYNNLTYFVMGQLNINSENSLRMFISSYTDNPDVSDLQDIYDISNVQYITRGNSGLNPAYTNSVRFHYTNSNVEKGRTFMWMFSMQNTSDYVSSDVQYNPGPIVIDDKTYNPLQLSSPVNMNGYWSMRTHLSYGFPVGFLKSNFNLMGGVNYSQIPSRINGERNEASTLSYDAMAVLGSNISENVDFTLSWNGTYYNTTNSIATSGATNRYFNHTASADMKFILPLGFTFTASAAYTQYVGFTNSYDDTYLLCNAYVGKKIFRNQRGEIMVGVNDIFNQNQAFVRTTGSGWTQNATNSVIGRYFMVQFNYNLRRFGKKGSKNMKDYEGAAPSSGSSSSPRRMMPPSGGGMGGGRYHGH